MLLTQFRREQEPEAEVEDLLEDSKDQHQGRGLEEDTPMDVMVLAQQEDLVRWDMPLTRDP